MKKLLFALALSIGLTASALAAQLPYITGPIDPGALQLTLNQLIQSINQNIGGSGYTFGRNMLDNGDMWVDQRGTSAATCATTSGLVEVSYSADRWGCDVDFTTGAGQLATATSSPTPPTGFINEETLVRNSGALGNPTCAWQELNTQRATAMQGQTVDFSVYLQALAGLSADNGNTAFLTLITGTTAGGNDGMGALRGAVGMTTSTKASSFTVSTTTGIITNATAAVAGQPVYMTAATMPTGFTAGQIYYISSTNLTSGTSFSVASTYAGAIAGQVIIPTSGGTTNVINVLQYTPVWTGLAVYGANGATGATAKGGQGAAMAQSFTLSASNWGRSQTGPIYIPTNVTEAAVGICFTPNSSSSGGSTDGIAFTGAQLEILPPNVVTASPYEFKSPQQEVLDAERYYWQINDRAAGTQLGGTGTLLTTTTCQLEFPLPVQMDVAPVSAAVGTITTTTFQIYVAADTSTLTSAGLTANTNSVNVGSWTATLTTASTAGWACSLVGQTAQAVGFDFGADF
jgi:hypothetical protein